MPRILIDHQWLEVEVSNSRSAVGNYLKMLGGVLKNGEKNEVVMPRMKLRRQCVFDKNRILRKLCSIAIVVKKFFEHRNGIIRHEPDVRIIFHSPFQILSFVAAPKVRTVLIYDAPTEELIGEFVSSSALIRIFCRIYDRFVLHRSDVVVVYSSAVRRYISDDLDVCCSDIRVHQNVDFDRVSAHSAANAPSEVINVVFIGSFLPWHGVKEFLTSLQHMDNVFRLHLHMCGDGPDRVDCEILARHLPENIEVDFYGFLEAPEIVDILEASEIGLMPNSNWFGAPAKIFEYLAADCFVYAPRTPTIEDVFQSVPGMYLFPWENLDHDFKRCLNSYVKNYRGQKSNREWFHQRYSREKTTNFYLNIIS